MIMSEIIIPPSLKAWLDEFRTTPLYICGVKTMQKEREAKTPDQLHEFYERRLDKNVLGRLWLQYYAMPELAMDQILTIELQGEMGNLTRNDFCNSLCVIMELEKMMQNQSIMDTFPRKAFMDYISRIECKVSSEWENRVDILWEMILNDITLLEYIAKAKAPDVFNRHSVYSILGVLINNKVYVGTGISLSKLLEQDDKKMVDKYRPSLSKGLPSKQHLKLLKQYMDEA